MRDIFHKTVGMTGTIVLAVPLFLLSAAPAARAGEPTTSIGLTKGNPQDTFDINERDMPAVDGSWFRPPDAGYNASNGTVSVSGGEVTGNVYGGIDPAGTGTGGASNNNKVEVSNVEVGGNVTGGWSRSGTTSGNAVIITNSSVGGLIYGGWVRGGTTAGGGASSNTVTITSGVFNDNIYGGFSQGSNGIISENKVVINGGDIEKGGSPGNDPHIIAGGYSSVGSNVAVKENEVTISGGTITNFWIYGGRGQTNATTITNNTVTITGGVITSGGNHSGDKGSYIYGGEGITGSAQVLDNHIRISGGDITATMYGGYARAGGAVTENDVTLSGGTTTGDIYGGYSVSGVATNNEVTIDDAAVLQAAPSDTTTNLYGGYSGSGRDAFTGNTLKKNNAAFVNAVRNFQNVNFGYAGNANITLLDTTASGSSQSGVTLSTGGNTITFGGTITGTGDLTKTGTGTLFITGDANAITHSKGVTVAEGTVRIGDGAANGSFATPKFTVNSGATLAYNREDTIAYGGLIAGDGTLEQQGGTGKTGTLVLTGNGSDVKNVEVTGGTLQIGDGGANGSLAAETFTLAADTALAYKKSDAVSYTGHISGEGKVVQRGGGSLLLNDAANPTNQNAAKNAFTGGTEIESGTLYIVDLTSYNQATKNGGTKAGYITFTGAQPGARKHVTLLDDVIQGNSVFHNSFRTDDGAGTDNHVDLTAFGSRFPVTIRGNALQSDQGGAFYVADGTAMNVNASQLVLGGDNYDKNLFNKAAGENNDLYIGQNAEFNLHVDDYATFNSGIAGTGTLNLRPLVSSSSARPYASVYLINNTSVPDAAQTFHTGTTNVEGNKDKAIILSMARGRIDGDNDIRVTFRNDNEFNLNQYALLSADGTITAGDTINIEGGGLYPHAMSRHDMSYDEKNSPGTLRLEAPEINLADFTMIYDIKEEQKALKNDNFGLSSVSNNSLLDFDTGSNKVILDNGAVYFRTTTGSPFKTDDYLVMRSNNGFKGTGISEIDNDTVNEYLTAYIDGFTLDPGSGSVRGGGMQFVMGGDPNATGDNNDKASNKNIWLSAVLDSLSMDWTGGASQLKSGNLFDSEQGDDSTREHSFMPGDKVYISQDGANIELLSPGEEGSPEALAGLAVTVSGLVVGKNTAGETKTGGVYIFSGAGGLTADKGSAHGQYVDKAPKDDIAADDDTLNPTGKLEKFGGSTLTFRNEGTNVFLEGIELSGGTTQFTRAEQLMDASYLKTQSEPDDEPTYSATNRGGTTFLDNATLEALADVELYNHITVANAIIATLSAAEGRVFSYHGVLTGTADATLNKTGLGTLKLFSDLDADGESGFAGRMTVNQGILDVRGSFGHAAAEVYGNNGGGTLSGTGFLQEGGIFASGTLAPGTVEKPLNFLGDLTLAAGGHFKVSLENNGAPRSEYVTVGGETTITPGAILDVAFDYRGSKGAFGDVYRIIEATAGQTDEASTFTLGGVSSLPRGLTWEQGWNLVRKSRDEYQLRLLRDFSNGVDDIPDLSNNEHEIGKIIDDMLDNPPGGPMWDLADRITDPGLGDDEVRRRLNQLTGDLTANALSMAFKEPWRHPFNRLNHGDSAAPSDCVEPGRGTRLWAEFPARREETDSDGNARDFSLRRYGVALGLDTRISPRLTLGANLQFSRPTLRQDTGRVTADDLELGVYGLAAVTDTLDMKAYLGCSWQNYDFKRAVSLPASSSGKYAALHENLGGETGGRAVAASLELIRPIDLRPSFRLSPLAALDYENVRVDGYAESGGLSALVYDDREMDRLTLRAGLSAEYALRDRAALTARAYYGYRVAGREYPSAGVHFAVDDLSRRADIRGVASGRHSLHLGVGGSLKLGNRDNSLLYLNYDARLTDRTVTHAAEVGFMLAW